MSMETILPTERQTSFRPLEDEMSGIEEPQKGAGDDAEGDREFALAYKAKEICTVKARRMLFVCPNCGRNAMGVKEKGGSINVECPTCGIKILVV